MSEDVQELDPLAGLACCWNPMVLELLSTGADDGHDQKSNEFLSRVSGTTAFKNQNSRPLPQMGAVNS